MIEARRPEKGSSEQIHLARCRPFSVVVDTGMGWHSMISDRVARKL